MIVLPNFFRIIIRPYLELVQIDIISQNVFFFPSK